MAMALFTNFTIGIISVITQIGLKTAFKSPHCHSPKLRHFSYLLPFRFLNVLGVVTVAYGYLLGKPQQESTNELSSQTYLLIPK